MAAKCCGRHWRWGTSKLPFRRRHQDVTVLVSRFPRPRRCRIEMDGRSARCCAWRDLNSPCRWTLSRRQPKALRPHEVSLRQRTISSANSNSYLQRSLKIRKLSVRGSLGVGNPPPSTWNLNVASSSSSTGRSIVITSRPRTAPVAITWSAWSSI